MTSYTTPDTVVTRRWPMIGYTTDAHVNTVVTEAIGPMPVDCFREVCNYLSRRAAFCLNAAHHAEVQGAEELAHRLLAEYNNAAHAIDLMDEARAFLKALGRWPAASRSHSHLDAL